MLRFAALLGPETLEQLWEALNAINPQAALLVVFVLLFFAGCGLPLPEDIPLTFTGILVGLPVVQNEFGGVYNTIWVVALVCYSSILSGDLVAYHLGKKFGHALARHAPFKWMMPEHRVERLDRWFRKFGNWTVFLGRMVAGIRFVTFVMAGMARMPRSRFIIYDSLAALITVPAWIVLGYVLGSHFHDIVKWTARINRTTWIAVGCLVALYFVYRYYRRRVRRARKMETLGMGSEEIPQSEGKLVVVDGDVVRGGRGDAV